MLTKITYTVLIGLLLASTSITMAVPDPGLPDTLKLGGGPLVVGQSQPLLLYFINDSAMAAMSGALIVSSTDNGQVKYDSTVFINRMEDPSVMNYRRFWEYDSTTVAMGCTEVGVDANSLPPGNTAVAELYFTGLIAGTIDIDSGKFGAAGDFIFVPSGGGDYTPQYQRFTVSIIEQSAPPIITAPSEVSITQEDGELSFTVSAESEYDHPVTISMMDMSRFDDESSFPVASPITTGSNPVSFSWTPAEDDIGIWLATFEACDTTGRCATVDVSITVVSSPLYVLSFGISETQGINRSSDLKHGNFDDDANPELLISGYPFNNTNAFMVMDYSVNSGFVNVFGDFPMADMSGLQVGFLDDDNNLDAALIHFYNVPPSLLTLQGMGNNQFLNAHDTTEILFGRATALGSFIGDANLDLALIDLHGEVDIYSGQNTGAFNLHSGFMAGDSGTALNCADFDGDGFDDLAIGTATGVEIHLCNGDGSFTFANSYSQIYETMDIKIANQGSDFNNDGKFDLCISTPSVAGEFSDLMVYLGHGDGSFTQTRIRHVKGQVYGNCVGDFNADNTLDIAYVNGSQKYMAILFGDGSGAFLNEMRYHLPNHNPRNIDCFDVDLDGDLDIAVAAVGVTMDHSLYLMTNQFDPSGYYARGLDITAANNSEIGLTSSSGKLFSRIHSTFSSGDYYRRNIDQNSILDDFASIGAVESGAYTLSVFPKPNVPEGELFSLEFTLDDQLYRLAKNIPMTAEGYEFIVYAGIHSEVSPRPGVFMPGNPPLFTWPGDGAFDFQLANDIGFTDIVETASVEGNNYTLTTTLDVLDTTTFYWRVKPDGVPAFECLYAVNTLPGTASTCGDATGDEIVNVGDAVFMINYIFKFGSPPDPIESGDANCDDKLNVGDAVYLINYIFKGGYPPCCP